MSDRLDRIISGALAGAALIVAVSFAYRTFFAAAVLPAGASAALPRLSKTEWEEVLAASITLHGSADAPVTIVEFADLECPACAAYQPVIYEVAQRHGDAVRVVLSHFPLPRHRFALPAARALECADSAGAAAGFVREVYSANDSLGIVGWGEIARRAGIADTVRVRNCAQSDVVPPRVAAGRSLASQLHLDGTPTVFVNRWQFGTPAPETLDSVIISALRTSR